MRQLIKYTRLNDLWDQLYWDRALIIKLHRVSEINDERLSFNENLKITPIFLEKFINYYLERNFEFISLNKLYEYLENGEKLFKKVVITLDDGYLDNYQNAFPVFSHYNIPFTIYLSTLFIDSGDMPWWFGLEDLLLNKECVKINDRTYDIDTKRKKEKLFVQIRKILLNEENDSAKMEELFKVNNFNYPKRKRIFLKWNEINEMCKNPITHLGNHGHNHKNITLLNHDTIVNEFKVSRNIIKENTGIEANDICYPYGSYNKKTLQAVSQLNVQTAVTTNSDFVTYKYRNYTTQLPRVSITEAMSIQEIIPSVLLETRFGFNRMGLK